MAEQSGVAPASATDTLPGITTLTITSPGLGTTLRVSVARPVQAVIGGDPERAPAIIYTTDADFFFGSVVDAARVASFGGDIAPAAVVGIGYAEETGDLRFTTMRRFLDLYRGPRRSFDGGAYGKLEFGGADAFLCAIRDHVIPAVEMIVPNADPDRRVLLGASAGGHFATYVLSCEPELFHGYSLLSPMLVDPQDPADGVIARTAGDPTMVRLIEDLPEGKLPPGRRVFLAAGGTEEDPGTMFADFSIISNAYRMRTALVRHGVATDLVVLPGEGHGPLGAIGRALRFLLPPDAPKADWQAALAARGD